MPPAAATASATAASCIPRPSPVSNCISAAAPTPPADSSEPSSIDVDVRDKQQSRCTSSLDRVHWSRSEQTRLTSDYIALRVSCANEHSGRDTSAFELLGRLFFRSLLDREESPSDAQQEEEEERAARAELTKLVDALLAAPVEPRAVLLCLVHYWLSRERQQRVGLGVGVGGGGGRAALDACLRSVRLLAAALRALERRCAALSSCELLVAALCADTSSLWAAYLLALVSRRLLLASPG